MMWGFVLGVVVGANVGVVVAAWLRWVASEDAKFERQARR